MHPFRFHLLATWLAMLPASAALPSPAAPVNCALPPWSAEGDQWDCRFGTVAPAGDVNRDGYDDVLIGSYDYDHPEVDEGMVFLYLGGPGGLSATPVWTAEIDQAGAQLGDKLSGAGDVNGDGYDDVVIGAAHYSHGQPNEGGAFLYLGSPTGLSAQPVWSAEGDQTDAEFGACVQPAGDVNGDGFADVIVGAWLYNDPQDDEGKAFVYLGSPSGLATAPVWTGESNSTGAVYGYLCRTAGDVNGDGYDDIAVGARRFGGNGLSKEGRAYVYYGSPGGPHVAPDWIHDGGQAGGEFGAHVSTAGDVNRDGYDDLIVGAFRFDHPEQDEGMAYLFLGSATGLSTTPAWSAEGDQAGAHFGYHDDTAGDVNGDGYGDVILNAELYAVGAVPRAGRAYVYLGSPSGLALAPAWIQEGDQDSMGIDAVRGVGDVNRDGFDDVMTGSLYHDNALKNSGKAWAFYGCPGFSTGVPAADPPAARLGIAGANPFLHSIAIAYSIPAPAAVRLTVHDLAGRSVAVLIDGVAGAGRHTVRWNGSTRDGHPAAAGVYVMRFESAGESRSLKVVRLP